MKDLNLAIKGLKKNSACGEDGILNLMLIKTTQEFRKIILLLINETVKQAIIPESWKSSIINMIPKKQQNSSNPKDYRPISLTSCLGKLAERLMLKKIKDFMDKNKIIIKHQSGFRQYRQTRDNIFFLTQKGIESINRGKKMCAIFFDIASAFDKIWHEGVIYKMIRLNFPNYIICWVNEFLKNRMFAVRINNAISNKIEIEAGVPQGAVLSPTLFSIFINDMPMNFKKNKMYSLLFADDLCSLNIYKKPLRMQKQIQNYLGMIEKWLVKWRLMMSPSKCSYIIFSADKSNKESSKIELKLFQTTIPMCDNPTFLGIRFDKHLSFKNQLSYLNQACLKRLTIIKVLSNKSWGISSKTLTQVYNSLIRSLLEYSSIIYPRFSTTNLDVLERVQFKCLKIIHKKSKYDSNCLIRSLPDYLSLKDRFDNLNFNYIKKSLEHKNELMVDLFDEYIRYSVSRELGSITLFCRYKNLLNAL